MSPSFRLKTRLNKEEHHKNKDDLNNEALYSLEAPPFGTEDPKLRKPKTKVFIGKVHSVKDLLPFKIWPHCSQNSSFSLRISNLISVKS